METTALAETIRDDSSGNEHGLSRMMHPLALIACIDGLLAKYVMRLLSACASPIMREGTERVAVRGEAQEQGKQQPACKRIQGFLTKPLLLTALLTLLLASCTPVASPATQVSLPASPLPTTPPDTPPADAPTTIQPIRAATGDVAPWLGDWSPDGRFYVFFRWNEQTPCSGETLFAYDTRLEREVQLSSDDYCTLDVDPNMIWESGSTLILGDGPGASRWESIVLGDEITRAPLDTPPPACGDRGIDLPLALGSLDADVVRARWSPDKEYIAIATLPDDEETRFGGFEHANPEERLFQRLELFVFPGHGSGPEDLQHLGLVFDIGPDVATGDDDCPGTQLSWSPDGAYLISSLGPVVYEARSGEALLNPAQPTSGPLAPNLRWSPNRRYAADDFVLLNISSGENLTPPDMLPGFDKGFAGNTHFVYVNDTGLVLYNLHEQTSQQLTDFQIVFFTTAPDGGHAAYSQDGDLWLLPLLD